MASETVTLSAVCGGNNHLTFTLTGAKSMTVRAVLGEALDAITDDEAASFCKCLVKLGKVGRTNAQLRTLFENGVTVTV